MFLYRHVASRDIPVQRKEKEESTAKKWRSIRTFRHSFLFLYIFSFFTDFYTADEEKPSGGGRKAVF